MTNWSNISFSQKGWECSRCGRINAPWLPCCSCDKSTTTYATFSRTQDTTRNIQKQIDDNTIAEILYDIAKWRTWSHTYDNARKNEERKEE